MADVSPTLILLNLQTKTPIQKQILSDCVKTGRSNNALYFRDQLQIKTQIR